MNKLLNLFRWQSMVDEKIIIGEVPTNREIYKKTFDIAWPSAIESVLIALIGAVDMMMVGNLGSEAISAVGITTQPKFIILAMILALNTGVTVLVSRRKGEQNAVSANNYLRQAVILSVILSFLLSMLGGFFAKEMLLFAGANNEYIHLAIPYFRIIMFGNFFYCVGLTMTAAQRGAGNTRISMITNIAANLVNLIFNALLINGLFFFPRLEVVGAAIATAMGNIVSFCIAFYSVTRKGGFLSLSLNEFHGFDMRALKDIFNISSSSLIEQIFLRFGFLMYSKAVAGLGTIAFAAHQVCMQMMHISFSFGDGLSIANTSLVGQSLGRRRPDMAMIHGKVSQRLGITMAIIVSLFITVFRIPLMGMFTQEAEVIAAGSIPMMILSITVLFQIPQVIVVGSLRGAGDVKFVAGLMLLSVSIVRPVLAWTLTAFFGLIGAWIALLADQLTRNMVSSWRFNQASWTKIQL